MSARVEKVRDADDDGIREVLRAAHAPPGEARRLAVRAAIIASTAEPADPRPRRARWVGAAIAVAAAAAVAFALLRAPERARHLALPLRASGDARYDVLSTHTGAATDHVIRVHAGEVAVDVRTLSPYERLRVTTADSALDGDGVFEVNAIEERVDRVRVVIGAATLRLTGQRAVFLTEGEVWRAAHVAAGESWASATRTAATGVASSLPSAGGPASTGEASPGRSAATASSAPTPAARSGAAPEPHVDPAIPGARARIASPAHQVPVSPRDFAPPGEAPPPRRPAPIPLDVVAPSPDATLPEATPPADPKTPSEQHFVTGWALLRAQRYVEAAEELRLAGDGDQALSGDAMFLRGVALLRAGQLKDAEAALIAFQTRHPQSLRRGRAWLLLGAVRVSRGDRTGAIQCLAAAAADRDPAIADAARTQLATLRAVPR